jgi:outer membrane biosynthesis protein TonB
VRMRTASAISTGLHVAVLAWAVVSFTGETFQVTPAESLPVDIISEKDFSQLTKGIKEAPKPVEQPKPLVEKKAEPKPKIEDFKAAITEKQDLKPTQQKQEQQAQPKSDPIADKIAKSEKPVDKEEPKPLPPKKPPLPKQPKFDADKIAALLDQRAPQRAAITGSELNNVPSMGTALGNASQLSQSELDALRSRLMGLWNPPVGIKNPEAYVIRVRIQLNKSRGLSAPPILLSHGQDAIWEAAAASALRAVMRGQPYDMLKPEHYDTWKDIEVTFDPREMFGGG